MLYQQRKYLHFLLKASNQHGVHSPFIYQLVTQCFYKKIHKNLWKAFLNSRQYLKDNSKKKNNRNFGNGPNLFKSNAHPVSKVAKVAGISDKKAKLLIKTINYFKPEKILELGTAMSLGTLAIKTKNDALCILTLEECPETSKIVQKLFDKNDFKAIEIINGDFSKTLSKSILNKQFDCILFDSNHTKKATLNYFEECLKTVHNNSFFIFNDIYCTAEMQEAWSIIKKHSKVTVTVDVFYYGIVFFRKEQAKEHFKIRA
jgi:predicted O-methyltransferase YrrM